MSMHDMNLLLPIEWGLPFLSGEVVSDEKIGHPNKFRLR